VILAGDYNIIPTPFDVAKPERWEDDALFAPQARDAFAALVASGWRDSLRALHPDALSYTFWPYWRQSFERDAGIRIDHLLLNATLAPRLKAAGVDRFARALDKASDHAPAWVELLS
jgi:exodeoxyribonuclease-3